MEYLADKTNKTITINQPVIMSPEKGEYGDINSVDFLLSHWEGTVPVDPWQIWNNLNGVFQVTNQREGYYPGVGNVIYVNPVATYNKWNWKSRMIVARELQFAVRQIDSRNIYPQHEEHVSMTKMAMRTLLPLISMASFIKRDVPIKEIAFKTRCPIDILTMYLNKHINKGRLPAWKA